jgi:hypothetical protein
MGTAKNESWMSVMLSSTDYRQMLFFGDILVGSKMRKGSEK